MSEGEPSTKQPRLEHVVGHPEHWQSVVKAGPCTSKRILAQLNDDVKVGSILKLIDRDHTPTLCRGNCKGNVLFLLGEVLEQNPIAANDYPSNYRALEHARSYLDVKVNNTNEFVGTQRPDSMVKCAVRDAQGNLCSHSELGQNFYRHLMKHSLKDIHSNLHRVADDLNPDYVHVDELEQHVDCYLQALDAAICAFPGHTTGEDSYRAMAEAFVSRVLFVRGILPTSLQPQQQQIVNVWTKEQRDSKFNKLLISLSSFAAVCGLAHKAFSHPAFFKMVETIVLYATGQQFELDANLSSYRILKAGQSVLAKVSLSILEALSTSGFVSLITDGWTGPGANEKYVGVVCLAGGIPHFMGLHLVENKEDAQFIANTAKKVMNHIVSQCVENGLTPPLFVAIEGDGAANETKARAMLTGRDSKIPVPVGIRCFVHAIHRISERICGCNSTAVPKQEDRAKIQTVTGFINALRSTFNDKNSPVGQRYRELNGTQIQTHSVTRWAHYRRVLGSVLVNKPQIETVLDAVGSGIIKASNEIVELSKCKDDFFTLVKEMYAGFCVIDNIIHYLEADSRTLADCYVFNERFIATSLLAESNWFIQLVRVELFDCLSAAEEENSHFVTLMELCFMFADGGHAPDLLSSAKIAKNIDHWHLSLMSFLKTALAQTTAMYNEAKKRIATKAQLNQQTAAAAISTTDVAVDGTQQVGIQMDDGNSDQGKKQQILDDLVKRRDKLGGIIALFTKDCLKGYLMHLIDPTSVNIEIDDTDLDFLKRFLCAIPPSSASIERVFSLVRNVIQMHRYSLSLERLNVEVTLRVEHYNCERQLRQTHTDNCLALDFATPRYSLHNLLKVPSNHLDDEIDLAADALCLQPFDITISSVTLKTSTTVTVTTSTTYTDATISPSSDATDNSAVLHCLANVEFIDQENDMATTD
ncbi:hypothetical protein GQ42DRAFT_168570 [Ramicandelaber brevisporus]|nr:hypothetical protein GQ42DRAFT_168570 [Ramicandelaber brevisporus]